LNPRDEPAWATTEGQRRARHDATVAYDLVIRRRESSDPIDRQVWLTFALDTVALVQLVAHNQERPGIELPAFGLSSRYNHPVLFWRRGEVIVMYADDEYLSDLQLLASRLRAELVPADSSPES
jgi:hypothetical protein